MDAGVSVGTCFKFYATINRTVRSVLNGIYQKTGEDVNASFRMIYQITKDLKASSTTSAKEVIKNCLPVPLTKQRPSLMSVLFEYWDSRYGWWSVLLHDCWCQLFLLCDVINFYLRKSISSCNTILLDTR